MKLLEINTLSVGSTGGIVNGIVDLLRKQGDQVINCYPKSRTNKRNKERDTICIGGVISRNIHRTLSFATGLEGCFSILATYRFLRKVRRISPDIIHLHNLHDSYINIPILFHFIKKHSIRTVWTLHDCWPFTGHCPHYSMEKCYKWESECYNCPLYKEYPKSLLDNSRYMYKLKKRWFTGVSALVIYMEQ